MKVNSKSMLRPDKSIQKLIISSPCFFVGEFETDELLITHAFPLFNMGKMNSGSIENPYSRNYFVVVFKTESDRDENNPFSNYSQFGESICVCLSVYFGKKFYFNEMLEINGLFNLPNLETVSPNYLTQLGINSQKPRKDLEVGLDLTNLHAIKPLIEFDHSLDDKFTNSFLTAGRFYLRAIRNFENAPELAFLDMVTCGEILSNYFNFSEEELYDDSLKAMFEKIGSSLSNGEIKQLKGRLFQIKKRYTLTITKLLNDYFFTNTESNEENGRLKQENIEKRIQAIYDLRSIYVHEGTPFGKWLWPYNTILNEIQIGKPVTHSEKLSDLLFLTPTFLGIERIMRFCLLRLIHQNAFAIDKRLNN